MNGTALNIALVVLFILIGGMFAAAEIALVSLRDSQVKSLAGRGKRGHAVARLSGDANRFLAAVQIGVTEIPACGTNDEVLKHHGLDAASLADHIASVVGERTPAMT